MRDEIIQYVAEINRQYQTGTATEHTHRPALQRLLSAMLPQFIVSNEPKQIACGAPDLLLLRKNDNIPAAYVETKNINDSDIAGKKKNKEQFNRYKLALDNIIFTDYLDFHLYEKGAFVVRVRLAELKENKITLLKESVAIFESIIERFDRAQSQTIGSSAVLAEIMASKTRLMAEVIEKVLVKKNGNNGTRLAEYMAVFEKMLVHDITPKAFAGVYAQTITYGMFAARLRTAVTEKFSRKAVAELIPKSNPFLRELFHYIAGLDIDERLRWIVDDLAEVFSAVDMQEVMRDFGDHTQQNNPIIHFYENFLTAYDPTERKNRGVWYTPQPVVNFIVKSVDEILRRDFNLPMGLADTTKVKVQGDVKVHKVQILDPATGTGTFLAETVSQIYEKFQGQTGIWQSYVEQHLIPRLNGFEILMAPYAIAHINLAWVLEQTGFEATGNVRYRVFLTNSLEEFNDKSGEYLFPLFAREAKEAGGIKRDVPVMVVMGNPPYNVSSYNKEKWTGWLTDLLSQYKEGLKERNIQPLSDDYIKFIRYGQHYIEKNGEGILAYISNNSFLDGLIHRQMRKHLLETFDTIYIINLHGNAKKKEKTPDGSNDQNIFAIRQGVSINIFVKSKRKTKDILAKVYYFDLFGKRTEKFAFARSNDLNTVPWKELKLTAPQYFFVPKDFRGKREYEKGFKVSELFPVNSCGVESKRDSLFLDSDKKRLKQRITRLLGDIIDDDFRETYNVYNSSSYQLLHRLKNAYFVDGKIRLIAYRPFDHRFIYYDENLIGRPFYNVMQHFIKGNNVGLLTCRRQSSFDFQHVFISNIVTDRCTVSLQTSETTYVFPLYTYSDETAFEDDSRTPNLDITIVNKIAECLALEFENEKSGSAKKFAPIDLLDYIYAVLHSPSYRERYKEFLKVDFPRVPYPVDVKTFWKLVKLGKKLRQLHLMENVVPRQGLANYGITGDNVVEKLQYSGGKVWINDVQYFDHVPLEVWNFYIGGYQPAQKWLKDRKGRILNFDDVQHYQKIVFVLSETKKVMSEIKEENF